MQLKGQTVSTNASETPQPESTTVPAQLPPNPRLTNHLGGPLTNGCPANTNGRTVVEPDKASAPAAPQQQVKREAVPTTVKKESPRVWRDPELDRKPPAVAVTVPSSLQTPGVPSDADVAAILQQHMMYLAAAPPSLLQQRQQLEVIARLQQQQQPQVEHWSAAPSLEQQMIAAQQASSEQQKAQQQAQAIAQLQLQQLVAAYQQPYLAQQQHLLQQLYSGLQAVPTPQQEQLLYRGVTAPFPTTLAASEDLRKKTELEEKRRQEAAKAVPLTSPGQKTPSVMEPRRAQFDTSSEVDKHFNKALKETLGSGYTGIGALRGPVQHTTTPTQQNLRANITFGAGGSASSALSDIARQHQSATTSTATRFPASASQPKPPPKTSPQSVKENQAQMDLYGYHPQPHAQKMETSKRTPTPAGSTTVEGLLQTIIKDVMVKNITTTHGPRLLQSVTTNPAWTMGTSTRTVPALGTTMSAAPPPPAGAMKREPTSDTVSPTKRVRITAPLAAPLASARPNDNVKSWLTYKPETQHTTVQLPSAATTATSTGAEPQMSWTQITIGKTSLPAPAVPPPPVANKRPEELISKSIVSSSASTSKFDPISDTINRVVMSYREHEPERGTNDNTVTAPFRAVPPTTTADCRSSVSSGGTNHSPHFRPTCNNPTKLKKAWLERLNEQQQSFGTSDSMSRTTENRTTVVTAPNATPTIRQMSPPSFTVNTKFSGLPTSTTTTSPEHETVTKPHIITPKLPKVSSEPKKPTNRKRSKSGSTDSAKHSKAEPKQKGDSSESERRSLPSVPKAKKARRSNKSDSIDSSSEDASLPFANMPTEDKQINSVGHEELRRTGQVFVQDGLCKEITPKLQKCRECRITPPAQSTKIVAENLYCRFYAFRKLKYSSRGTICSAGYSSLNDASGEDIGLWVPSFPVTHPAMDLATAKHILEHCGAVFCRLVEQEREATTWSDPDDERAWKQAVMKVREMCDVCNTTLFDVHWTCRKCGFVVCIDCFKAKRELQQAEEDGLEKPNVEVRKWLTCISANRTSHKLDELMLTEIIPGKALWKLSKLVHELRKKWDMKELCHCERKSDSSIKENGLSSQELVNALQQYICPPDHRVNGDDVSSSDDYLHLLADVACSNPKAKEETGGGSSSSEQADADRLKGLLEHVVAEKFMMQHSPNKKLIHYRPRPELDLMLLSPPVRQLSAKVVLARYPSLPHQWLCEGRMLRLIDAYEEDNYTLFLDFWKRQQPVMVSGTHKRLNADWRPSFFRDAFGERVNNLVNCVTGVEHVGHAMKAFWEGFEKVSVRLKDKQKHPMVLKLKDWPPGEDFSVILPDHYRDLNAALPIPQYTRRDGSMNLASRQADFFVKPDLGPKLYNAYGNCTMPNTGSTNLHLDISDACNVMLYVGVPEDDREIQEEAAMQLIRDAGCDESTLERCENEVPGALWRIFDPADSNNIRDFLNKVAQERGEPKELWHDPIHDQSWFLDQSMIERLEREYGVRAYTFVQFLGDAVFIPCAAAHQVQNIHSCIKAAHDFVSPEHIGQCFLMTEEFRNLSDTHANHEDKLQVKNILYHSMKDAAAVLTHNDPGHPEPDPTRTTQQMPLPTTSR